MLNDFKVFAIRLNKYNIKIHASINFQDLISSSTFFLNLQTSVTKNFHQLYPAFLLSVVVVLFQSF